MKIYISGGISNNPNYIEQFGKVERMLTRQGHAVINPAAKNLGFTYKEYIDLGLCELMRCEAIYMLEGYENSAGARLELLYAQTIGMRIFKEV